LVLFLALRSDPRSAILTRLQRTLLKSILKNAYIEVAEQLSNSSWDFVRNLTTSAHDAMRAG